MKICVIGLGYIGLPTSAMFAKHGVEVVGVDINSDVVDKLNRGEVHIEEPELEKVVKEAVNTEMLRASPTPEVADVFIVAVPTPNQKDEHKSCDLTGVLTAVKKIIPYIKKGNILIVESTIAPRSMDDYVKPLVEEAGFEVGKDIFLVHCPERVLPGKIMHEIVYNNRIVGGVTPACAKRAAQVYGIFVKGEIVETDAKTAEMSKLMENTFRDVNIALSNELAKVCNNLEINVLDVIEMANKHPRVNLHRPGPGVGGHCLAIDPYFIVAKAPELTNIIRMSRDTNISMPSYVMENVRKLLKGIEKPKVAVFGVTYKGNTDDMRESPALEIINLLHEQGYEVTIHDPYIQTNFFKTLSAEEALEEADLLLVLADHSEFSSMDYNKLASKMRQPLLFDTRNFIVENPDSNMEIINFGNIYKVLQENEVVV
ncbi:MULTISPECIES: nucleotide sugar dehydrogenase [Bacillus cereus group]|uniref:UDP-N-acetyl-D-mannosamine dehydrogenase n=1 Tax=Bacillus thuringiensis serovar mexicanensis TaxID=180868 RepID=A0A242W3A7_BACTU|nr:MULTISPECIES: nucleotide sugar dehydrogenase [Bacillus cereus group]MEB9668027.1 nucleotide sugar dehydrogenase [Bacillus anthracis]OTW45338.1 UDP-N-acetyl-D-mannosamine dehydrogenase [Bacillus thuringiensis serovar mexicanensis]OTW94546.1 UDP-N-acetyl-D-mannosamine dehydrogenase [Bacillus thuringiensis serovar monterrey]